jgi:hypothetical protein
MNDGMRLCITRIHSRGIKLACVSCVLCVCARVFVCLLVSVSVSVSVSVGVGVNVPVGRRSEIPCASRRSEQTHYSKPYGCQLLDISCPVSAVGRDWHACSPQSPAGHVVAQLVRMQDIRVSVRCRSCTSNTFGTRPTRTPTPLCIMLIMRSAGLPATPSPTPLVPLKRARVPASIKNASGCVICGDRQTAFFLLLCIFLMPNS